jgi:hypothetical protein
MRRAHFFRHARHRSGFSCCNQPATSGDRHHGGDLNRRKLTHVDDRQADWRPGRTGTLEDHGEHRRRHHHARDASCPCGCEDAERTPFRGGDKVLATAWLLQRKRAQAPSSFDGN